MKRFTIAFILSVILHLLFVYFASLTRTTWKPRSVEVFLAPYPEWISIEKGPSARAGGRSGQPNSGMTGAAPAGGAVGAGEIQGTENTVDGGMEGMPVPKPLLPLKSPFASKGSAVKAAKAARDSVTASRVADWFAEQDFSGVKAFHDAVEERIQRRAGGSEVFSPWKGKTAESHKEEKNPLQLDFLPDETHVQVMSTLYEKGKATQKDLYLALDPSIPMTAGLLNKQLDFLVEKGLVTRKKISPENLFGIATPFGVLGIEMSRKNKLNPVYEYKSQVGREKLLAYLQSNEFLLRERLQKAVPGDTAMVQGLIRRCGKEMGILAR